MFTRPPDDADAALEGVVVDVGDAGAPRVHRVQARGSAAGRDLLTALLRAKLAELGVSSTSSVGAPVEEDREE
jgi:hypothetical protein